MNNSYQNQTITHDDGKQYEINWVTTVAQIVLDKYHADRRNGGSKALSFNDIVSLLRLSGYIVHIPQKDAPYLHICLTSNRFGAYEIFVHLLPEHQGQLGRCIVIDYKVSDDKGLIKASK